MPEEPTTPDLEEKVRQLVEAFVRHDFDGVLPVYRPDAVWDMSSMGMGVFKGREAIRGFLEDWLGAWEDYEQVMEEFCDLGKGVTFAVFFQRGRPPGSSAFVALRYAQVGIWTDALVERATIYTDIDQARAAAERLVEERG